MEEWGYRLRPYFAGFSNKNIKNSATPCKFTCDTSGEQQHKQMIGLI